eukprot:TRINITY_DN1616_c0_g3_i1.p1 TRINITY_DN1616_c0_g3~~TRINITY_DN1616_c0_g3_i1.p1  ORF type:complete len:214 (-),score=89.07 TRINITY_DN1616_c0_g3_i1:69-710(-)
MNEKIEKMFKVIVVGESAVGKTSIIQRYVNGNFSTNYKYTIGVDFALKNVFFDEKRIVRLQLWDIAGQERFVILSHVYYKEAVGACVVFDLTNHNSLLQARKWKQDIDAKVYLSNGQPVPTILLANKCDDELNCKVTNEEIAQFARDNKFIAWFATSAKENKNIDEAMLKLIECIFEALETIESQNNFEENLETIKPNVNINDQRTTSKCCGW